MRCFMPKGRNDRKIIDNLTAIIGSTPRETSYGKFDTLYSLSLSGQLRNHIPSLLWSLRDLHTLDLSNCKLDHLPSEIRYLSNLRALNLRANHISHLPSQIGQL